MLYIVHILLLFFSSAPCPPAPCPLVPHSPNFTKTRKSRASTAEWRDEEGGTEGRSREGGREGGGEREGEREGRRTEGG